MHKLSELEASMVGSGRAACGGSSSVVIWAKGLVLVRSSAKLSITEQKVSPQRCESVTDVGPVLSWWYTSGRQMKFTCLKGLFTNPLREELSPSNLP